MKLRHIPTSCCTHMEYQYSKVLKSLFPGDPSVFGNFNPPPELLKAVSDNLETSCYGYVPAHGLVSTREAIAKYYNSTTSPLTSSVMCTVCVMFPVYVGCNTLNRLSYLVVSIPARAVSHEFSCRLLTTSNMY